MVFDYPIGIQDTPSIDAKINLYGNDILAAYLAYCEKHGRSLAMINEIVQTIQEKRNLEGIQPHHHAQAMSIRRYYRLKYTKKVLDGGELSKYQQACLVWLNRRPTDDVLIDEIRIISRIPDFYAEDIILDSLASEYPTYNKSGNAIPRVISTDMPKTLTIKAICNRLSKDQQIRRYWLVDEDNHLFLLMLDYKNPLMFIFDRMFEVSKSYPFTFTARYSRMETHNLSYWTVTNWSIPEGYINV